MPLVWIDPNVKGSCEEERLGREASQRHQHARAPTGHSSDHPQQSLRKSKRTMKRAFSVLFATAVMSAAVVAAQLNLPGGIDMESIGTLGATVEACNGTFADIVSLYMQEGTPLVEKITDLVESEEDVELGDAATDVVESAEFEALLNSSSLLNISENLNVSCVVEDPTFVALFEGIVGGFGIDEDHDLHFIVKDGPALASGFHECGGRIHHALAFAQGALPMMFNEEGDLDVMAAISGPHFNDFVATGFDLSCFMNVPEVGGFVAKAMG